MKVLSFLYMACMVMILYSCKKENQQPSQAPSGKAPHIVNYTNLPAGGAFVNINFGNGKTLPLYKVDTQYILDGDMVLTPEQIGLLKTINSGNARTFTIPWTKYWGSGIVAYTFNANLTTGSRNTILAAMADWEANVPGLDFVARTSHANYIEFNASTGNNSPVGRSGGKQIINLVQDPSWGVDQTSATHEIGHSIGMFHEQSRTDRGSFINVNTGNIRSGALHNFQTYAQRGLPGTQLGTFDFNSIMLYPSVITDANFVFNTSIPTMTRLDGSTWGWNWWLSAGDIETARYMYGAPFARLRYVLTYENRQFGYEETIHDVYIDFFADRNCTQPTTLNINRPFNMRWTENHYGVYSGSWSQQSDFVMNLNAGNQSYLIGSVNWHLTYDASGTTLEDVNQSYQLFEAFAR